MENKKKLSTGAIIGIVVLAVLSLAALISYIVMTVEYCSGVHRLFEIVATSVLFIAVAYYAIAGYKKPHGDLLRCVFLVFSAKNFVAIISDILFLTEHSEFSQLGIILGIILRGISIILTAYVSGRLDKVKKNAVPLAIVLISHLANVLLWYFMFYRVECSVFEILYISTSLIFCIDLIIAYVLRYREHKQAGLADRS